jgi:ABC-type multidrug transport system fused ATPase/permease subunit
MWTGERQSGKMRAKYLKSMLSQDVGFFDTDISTGEIVSRISSDTILLQDAIGEKVHPHKPYAVLLTSLQSESGNLLLAQVALTSSCLTELPKFYLILLGH